MRGMHDGEYAKWKKKRLGIFIAYLVFLAVVGIILLGLEVRHFPTDTGELVTMICWFSWCMP